ncbi:MAG: GGDEF domain-containing protein [Leptolyngbyaceae cyanobacterium SL_5_14]|nr:GGDEF domain-containing protein [Leptolyngbyaceae cyanobacterium SL_5_14]
MQYSILAHLLSENARLKAENVKLHDIAYTDPLTKVFSRRYFQEQLQREWDRCYRQARPLGLLFIDIDNLKMLNTALGHYGADQAIALIATKIKECAKRATDIVARYGGDEFVVLLSDIEPYELEYLIACIEQTIGMTGYSVSCGYCILIPGLNTTPQNLIEYANQQMYNNKNTKKAEVA